MIFVLIGRADRVEDDRDNQEKLDIFLRMQPTIGHDHNQHHYLVCSGPRLEEYLEKPRLVSTVGR